MQGCQRSVNKNHTSVDSVDASHIRSRTRSRTMTVKNATTSPQQRSISNIKSSKEARRVIEELMRKKSVLSAEHSSTENKHLRHEREKGDARDNAKQKCDIPSISDVRPRSLLERNSLVRQIAGRLLVEDSPRRSKSETHLNQALPELDAAQKSASMTQLVTLSPKSRVPQSGSQLSLSSSNAGIGNGTTHDDPRLKGNVKSPGHFTRKLQEQPRNRQHNQSQHRQPQRQPHQHRSLQRQDSSQTFGTRLRSQSESCLVQPGKRMKQPSRAPVTKSNETSASHFSPGSERRTKPRDSRKFGFTAVDSSKNPPTRTRAVRERSFDMTLPGYDVRYDLPVELPHLTDMEKEVEADFRNKSIDKCRRWMDRWVPEDMS